MDQIQQQQQQQGGKMQFSRTYVDRERVHMPRKASIALVDTKNVRIYFRRQASRASIQSASSTGLSESILQHDSSDAEKSQSIEEIPAIIHVATNTAPVAHPIMKIMQDLPRSNSVPNLLRRTSILDKMVCEVFEYLYMGNIESAYNLNLLCRLNIGYIVDVSNIEPHKVPKNKRSDCPCLCSSETAHSRVRMTLNIDENSQADLLLYFKDVNDFITSAKSCGKCVLIHSFHGRNRCAVFVTQYLMMLKKIDLATAERLVASMMPNVKITDNFYKSLKRWENSLLNLCNSGQNNLKQSCQFATTKSAWI